MPYQLFNEVEILVLVNIYSCACAILNCSQKKLSVWVVAFRQLS